MKTFHWTPADLDDPAIEHWMLERLSNGPVYNTHHILIVRHKDGSPARVLHDTTDWQHIRQIEDAVRNALDRFTAGEFMEFFRLGMTAAAAAAATPSQNNLHPA